MDSEGKECSYENFQSTQSWALCCWINSSVGQSGFHLISIGNLAFTCGLPDAQKVAYKPPGYYILHHCHPNLQLFSIEHSIIL